MKIKFILSVVTALCFSFCVSAKVVMPQLFQSGMVVQRGKPVIIWGKADKGEKVTVTFRKKVYETSADGDGNWRVRLPKQKAGGPYVIRVNDLEIKDVLVGDVWLCSGQSNMDLQVERVYPQYTTDIDSYSNNDIRLFHVHNETALHGPKSDVRPTSWKPVTKENAWNFSAIGYFLAREMYEKTKVPQGIIADSWGGTPIQSWISADTMKNNFPMEYRRSLLYQNDEMIRSQMRANQLANQRWFEVMNETDPGMSEDFTALGYDDSKWIKKNQYDNLTGERSYMGSFWVRQHIKVDAAHAGKPARLLVGTLYDQDYTYVNGQKVGETGYQYPPRRYNVPAGLLREGDNALTVRFITKGGNPHFIKDKPYKLIFEDGVEIPLSEQWSVREGARMPRCHNSEINVHYLPITLYNAMIYPLAPYPVSGVVWYQGESNTGDGQIYESMLTKLIENWRQLWNDSDMPFVVVQLANFMEPSDKPQDSGWSWVREAQRLTAKHVPNTELAVAIDLGEAVDIHPLRKREVAQRAALGFEKMLINPKVKLSPEVISLEVKEGNVVLTLDQQLKPGTLYEFELAGADGRYHNAEAVADGSTITIKSSLKSPKSVRYAWKNNPIRANAYGKNELPLSPFQLVIGE